MTTITSVSTQRGVSYWTWMQFSFAVGCAKQKQKKTQKPHVVQWPKALSYINYYLLPQSHRLIFFLQYKHICTYMQFY